VRALVVVVALVAFACGSTPKKRKRSGERDETAAEYQRRKAKEAGELDEQQSDAGKWGGWKYQGERDDCRYVLGRKCFTKRDNACKAAKCKTECLVDGGGPAVVTCAKPKTKAKAKG
jgi:hypothetical protein